MQTILIGLDTRINNYASIDLMQGYNYTLEAHITDNYKDVDLTGVTVQLQMQKPDKKIIIQTENIIIEGNKIKAALDKDFTRIDGQANLQVVLFKDEFTFGSWVVKAKIKPSAINDNDGQSENKVTITETLVNKINEAENTKIELDKSIANGDVTAIKGNFDKIKDVEIPKINEQLDTKANILDVFLKKNGININDFDEATRETFLELQGIDVNYTLGENNVHPQNIFGHTTNYFNSYVEGKLYRSGEVTSIIEDENNITTEYIEVKTGDVVYSNVQVSVYEMVDEKMNTTIYRMVASDFNNEITIEETTPTTKYIRVSLLKKSIKDINRVTITVNKKLAKPIPKGKTAISWLGLQPENIGFDLLDVIDINDKINKNHFSDKAEPNINTTSLAIGRLKRENKVTFIDSTITNYRTTDYIPVKDGDIIYCENSKIVYETVNDNLSITRYSEGSDTFTIDNGSSFIRISFPIDTISQFDYIISKNISVEDGKKITDKDLVIPWLKVTEDNILSSKIDITNGYDFWNNYLVVPDDLYFVKDYEYSIIADNFCMNKRALNSDLKFEMTLPTYTELQQDTIKIKSPIEQKFETRLSIIQGATSAFNRAIDVKLNFKDVNKIKEKTCNVMIIGDSIMQAKMSSLTDYWLKNFGLTPNFIGTVSDANDNFGYGDPTIPSSMGEGRGGWRTTDFINTTKWLDGSHFDMVYSYKPFWRTTEGEFDFSYYMQENFPGVKIDYVIIALGTNDIGNGHYSGDKDKLYLPTEDELFGPTSEYYFPTMFNKMINSIKEYNSDVKIALAPPMIGGDNDNFNKIARRLASLEITYYRDVENVFVLGNYMAQGQYSGNWKRTDKVYNDVNTSLTYNFTKELDVHRNLAVAQNNGLWFASWIANMMN